MNDDAKMNDDFKSIFLKVDSQKKLNEFLMEFGEFLTKFGKTMHFFWSDEQDDGFWEIGILNDQQYDRTCIIRDLIAYYYHGSLLVLPNTLVAKTQNTYCEYEGYDADDDLHFKCKYRFENHYHTPIGADYMIIASSYLRPRTIMFEYADFGYWGYWRPPNIG
jgi:hypothetical protein